MDFVIIGSSIAGLSFAETIRKQDPESRIRIFSSEQEYPYNRMALSHMIGSDEVNARFYLHDESYYDELRFEMHLGTTVTKIHRDEKTIECSDGSSVPYDLLVLAVGAYSLILQDGDVLYEGNFSLRTHEDLLRINRELKRVNTVLVRGGGLLGIEAAYALIRANKKVIITDIADRLIPKQLDERASSIVRKEIEQLGATIAVGTSCKVDAKNGHVARVTFDDGSTEAIDMVLHSVGVRCNLELAQEAGLEISKGIVVNEDFYTQDSSILAIGDVATHKQIHSGLWTTARQMGILAAQSVLGMNDRMVPRPLPLQLKALDIGVYSVGTIESEESLVSESDGNYKRLNFKEDKLIGLILVGDITLSQKLYPLLNRAGSRKAATELLEINGKGNA